MIPKSFPNEIEKIAFLESIGKFLATNVPSMLSSLKNTKVFKGIAAGAGQAQLLGGAVGAAGGAFVGSRTGTEDTKSRNTLIGALAGGVGGAMGAGKLVSKAQSFGASTAKDLSGIGKYMQRPGATPGKTIDYAAQKLSPQFAKVKGNAPTSKSLFGFGPETKAVGVQTSKPSMIGGTIGELAHSIKTVKDAPNAIHGIGKVLKQNWEQGKFYTKDIGGKTYKFQRSGIGRVVNPALTSGIGFGALEAATAKNEDGSKPTMSKRLLHGGTTALTWGAAPKLMFGKTLAYDVPKTLIGMKKQQELPTQ